MRSKKSERRFLRLDEGRMHIGSVGTPIEQRAAELHRLPFCWCCKWNDVYALNLAEWVREPGKLGVLIDIHVATLCDDHKVVMAAELVKADPS